ncbi:hypothetical protein WN943_016326 [Citrus x changshan-huyou]
MAQTQSQPRPHIAVLNFPFSTHASSVLSIIKRLAVSAPTALFTFFSTPQSNKALFSTGQQRHLPINVKPYDVSDGVPEGHVFSGKRQEDIELFMNAADANFRKAVEAAVAETGRPLTCLVTDAFIWFAAEMARDWNNVPWIPCSPAGPNSLSAHLYTDIIRDKIGTQSQNQDQQLIHFIPGMNKIRVADLPEGVVSGDLDSVFSVMVHQMGRQLPKAAAVFINSFEELDPELTNHLKTKFNKKFLSVGPFKLLLASDQQPSSATDLDDKYGCLAWLDKQKKKPASVAYVGFGTVATPSPNEIVAIAEALEASKVPFIWSLRHRSQANLPNGFLERTRSDGIVVDWAPQVNVLAHEAVGVFVTHCGWGSILESIAAGVPMIGRPFFGDQRINGRMMEQVWGVGVAVDGGGICTKEGLLSSLDLILCQEKGIKIREKVTKLKQLCQNAIGPGGSTMQNLDALVDMISRSY